MSAVREDLEKIRALVDEPTKWCQRISRQGPNDTHNHTQLMAVFDEAIAAA